MSCSVYIYSTGQMTYFSDFFFIAAYSVQIKLFSYLLMSLCGFVFRMSFFPIDSKNWLEKSKSSGSKKFCFHKKIGVLNAKQISHFLECSDKETSAIFSILLKQIFVLWRTDSAWLGNYFFQLIIQFNLWVILVAEETAGICYFSPQYLFSTN